MKALKKMGHEIATHTYSHLAKPSVTEIDNALKYLTNTCGIPRYILAFDVLSISNYQQNMH